MDLYKTLIFLLIFVLAAMWIYSGYSQISGFPPKIQEAQAVLIYVGGQVGSSAGCASENGLMRFCR